MFAQRSLSVVLIMFICLSITACSSVNLTAATETVEPEPSEITLTGEEEAGQRLSIYGEVIDSASPQPIQGVQIYIYHADTNGEYQPDDPADESTARLSGEVVTGESGQFSVHTILPGEYDTPGNRHIHLDSVRADGYEAFGGVILFDDNVNAEVRAWAEETGFGRVIELTERDGLLEGSLTIPLIPSD